MSRDLCEARCVSLTMDALSMLKAAVDVFLNKEVCSTYSSRYSRAVQLARSVREFLERSDDVPAAFSIVSAVRECVRNAASSPIAKMAEKREKASVAVPFL